MSEFTSIEGMLGELFANTVGRDFAGLVVLLVLLGWLAVGGYGFEVSLLAVFVLSFIMNYAGWMSAWFWGVNLLIAALIIFLALSKLSNKT
jgi:hypothetical protein